MQRPESRRQLLRAFVGVWLLLCLAPFVGAARGSATTAAAARPMAALATPSQPTPQASDGMPGVGCSLAPAPAAQGAGGDPGEPGELRWRVQAPAVPDATWFRDIGVEHPRLPVRIAFCRWLN